MAAAQYKPHVTKAGERWDQLAWIYYGDATNFAPILAANPTVPIVPVLPAGLTLAIPILQQSRVVTQDLPPWETGA